MALSTNLSLNALKTACGKASASLLLCGENAGADPISMGQFRINGVSGPTGFTYIVENTTETYSVIQDSPGDLFRQTSQLSMRLARPLQM